MSNRKSFSDAEWTKALRNALAIFRNGLHVQTLGTLPAVTVKSIRSAARRLEKVVDVRHYVRVGLAPAPVVKVGDGRCGFGVFEGTRDNNGESARICLGADLRPVAKDHGLTAKECRDFIIESLAHELVHYEQWRDCRPITEHGVAVRARNLLKQAGYFKEKRCASTKT